MAPDKHLLSAENPQPEGKEPHLLIRKGDLGEVVLMPGDPGRVSYFTSLCDDFHILASNREYTVGTGYYKGHKVSVCSTGIGAPSTEIAVIECIDAGAKALIRIGGTGVLKKEINCGEMVINTGAIRKGGSSNFYAPAEYPAIASYQVVEALVQASKKIGVPCWTGISASIGSFFAGQGRTALGKKFYPDDLLEKYERLNVLNMEMESETIMTLGSLFNVMTGCICAVHCNRITDVWMDDFKQAQENMCWIALEAAVSLEDGALKTR